MDKEEIKQQDYVNLKINLSNKFKYMFFAIKY